MQILIIIHYDSSSSSVTLPYLLPTQLLYVIMYRMEVCSSMAVLLLYVDCVVGILISKDFYAGSSAMLRVATAGGWYHTYTASQSAGAVYDVSLDMAMSGPKRFHRGVCSGAVYCVYWGGGVVRSSTINTIYTSTIKSVFPLIARGRRRQH